VAGLVASPFHCSSLGRRSLTNEQQSGHNTVASVFDHCHLLSWRSILKSSHTNLINLASSLPDAWRSQIVGNAAGANFKVVRMDGRAYPNELHSFNEALLVLEGQMNLQFSEEMVIVQSGEVYIVPAGVPHAVAQGSHGTLVIIDRDA
jgi:mannose-6-phosphate isomerase-like protein (cupin superfamily)